MNDKVNVCVIVPEINQNYNIILPINKKIGTITKLLNKSINELSNEAFPIIQRCYLYNVDTLQQYDDNTLLCSTDIRNSTRLMLLSKKLY